MAVSQFKFCCKVQEVGGFGESSSCADYSKCLLTLKGSIARAIEGNQVALVVTSTKCQKPLNKALRALGFKRTKWLEKPVHRGYFTVVAVWTLPLAGYEFPKGV